MRTQEKSKKRGIRRRGIYETYIKRPLDVICALSALLLFSPVMLVTAILVRIKLGSPIIFTQERPGLRGKIFKLYKFRSMSEKRGKDGRLLADRERLGSFGKTLRATSLDELPELINILKGDMSFVGPRPLLPEYLPYYSEKEKHRHDVRPGLTGWAQVNGRNAVSWDERFQLDVEYVKKITFYRDIKILLLTFYKVLKRSDILLAEESNMAEERKAFGKHVIQ